MKKIINYLKIHQRKIIKALVIILLLTNIITLFFLFNEHRNKVASIYLLNGSNQDVYSKNILLYLSNDHKYQRRTSGSLIVTNQEVLANTREYQVEMCYELTNKCFFAAGGRASNYSFPRDAKSATITISEIYSTRFKEQFIFDHNGKIFKNQNDFDAMLNSMYFKFNFIYVDGREKEIILNIKPNQKMNKHSIIYQLPHDILKPL